MNKYENKLVDLIFGNKSVVSFEKIKNLGREKPFSAASFWQSLRKASEELVFLGLVDKENQ